MAVKISGVLKDGAGKPVQNCTIHLKAKRNSTTVVVNTVASENPDEAGRYSMDVEYGQYAVILLVDGFPPSHAGTITVYEDSQPGTLNDFLGAMTEDDARPEALRRFELMVEEVARNASAVAQNTAAAKKSASDAGTSAREAATHATDAAGSARAASTSAGQAATSAQEASSGAETASAKAAEASKSAAAAESSKSAAATSAGAAKTSETNAAASQQSAATSASTATTKASEAATSARDAAASKEAAKSSETSAASSAGSAASSATAAGNSAKAAKTSETNARSSETAAEQSASAAAGSESTTTGDWTTAQFIGWLESQGAFNHPYWMCKGSWSYGNNKIITDTGCGNIHLAGAVIEVMGIKSAMTIRITTPTTSSGSGTANAQFTYINHGDGYSPGWRRDYNTKNKPPAFALGKTGETLADTDAVAWNLDSGAYCAQDGGASSLILHFNTGEGSCPAVQFRVNYRNGGIFYRSARDGYGFEADWERLFTTTGGTLDGAVGIGAQNTLGGHSLALGRGDTGLKQNGDGNLDVYAGNARVMRFTNGSIQVSKGLNVSGRVNPSDYSNFDIRYVRDIRLGTRVVQGMQKGVTYEKSGHVITGLCLVGDADGDNSAVYRPVQKYINGTWFNVSQV
ncbi:TPA: hypothetical protein HIP81_002884 [Escherichia coli]|nr:hypothetical protein [Escherichia coli]